MITVENLRKTFGGVRACADVTLTIQPGSMTAIVGPNGAGKSTFVQLLSGVVRPDAGRIMLGTTNITRMPPAQRFSLGMARTFQTARVFPGLSVMESVMLGAYHGVLYRAHRFSRWGTLRDASASLLQLPSWRARHQEAESRALQVIDLFGDRLRPRLGEFTFSLSYANRRRVEIARAIASGPRVLILDEPTAGMNPTETEELASLLTHLKDDDPDLTMIFVEHKMNVVRRMSQRVIVMDAGAVIADDTPEEALTDPRVIDAYLGSGGNRATQA